MLLPINYYNAEQAKKQNRIGLLLKKARIKKGLLQKELSTVLEKYGVTIPPATVSKWESGDILPNPYQLTAVCIVLGIKDMIPYFSGLRFSQYPELNAVGEKKVQEYVDTLVKSGKYAPFERKQLKYVEVTLYDLPVSAGTGVFLDDSSAEKIRFAASTVPEGTDYCLRISGDSMEPDYHDGQYVFVQETSELTPGEIGIFIYDECGYIKVLDTQTPDSGYEEAFTDSEGVLHEQAVLVSLNKEYAPIEISPYISFQIKGRVLN